MKIAITGSTGLIGSALSDLLTKNGHNVLPITRDDFSQGVSALSKKLKGVSGVIHLAGAPLMKRWSESYKQTIYQSRVETTSLLTAAINEMSRPPKVFVSASAVGIYDSIEVHDEYSTAFGTGFLAEVCADWESEATKVDQRKTRLVILRLGVVLARQGGALKKMLLPFKLGVGGKIGDGLQSMPFIHLHDLLKAVEWLVTTHGKKGIFNIVAPQMISNAKFTRTLARVLHRPAVFGVPEFALKAVYGEGAIVVTRGQKVVPARLKEEGFTFKFPDIESALQDLVK